MRRVRGGELGFGGGLHLVSGPCWVCLIGVVRDSLILHLCQVILDMMCRSCMASVGMCLVWVWSLWVGRKLGPSSLFRAWRMLRGVLCRLVSRASGPLRVSQGGCSG